MMGSVPYGQVAHAAQHGSPVVLEAAGRLLGLGAEERAALATGRIPWWLWATLGLSAGVVVGARAYRKWPRKFPKVISG
jgi:hypothetical protein